ncbi:MAG: GGDEF domain-containing protein [Gammaproteobacteria bacterium]
MKTNKTDAAAHDATVLVAVQDLPPMWQLLARRLSNLLRGVWSTTQFPEQEVSVYAEKMMLEETRRGIMLMAVLSFLVQVAAIALYQRLGIHASILYTYGLLSLLSVHVVISARFINETKALNLLGTLLLVITGVAIMAIAHRSGNLNSGLLSSVVLLFMVIPIAPWGLREAVTVVGLIYLTLTVSAMSVGGRFQAETLWTLQFLILASAMIATLVIARNTTVRKNDIRARFELEKTHRELELISTRDPLTGAWNRRYLDQNFYAIAQRAQDEGSDLYLALLDVDTFKVLNDNFGHHHGDDILKRLVQALQDNLPGTAHVLRLGGDEFAVLDTSENFEESVRQCLRHLETNPNLIKVSGAPVRVSAGFAKVAPENTADLDKLYRAADEALYRRKNARRENAETGVWRAIPT